MKKIIVFLMMLAMMKVFTYSALGEDYVDLNQRFDSITTYDYQGETYYMKTRVSTTLAMCVNIAEEGSNDTGNVELMVLLVIDDDDRMVYPIQIDPGMTADWLEGEAITLEQLFSDAVDVDSGCTALLDAINAAFPQPVCEHYAVLDLNGLPLLDNIENNAGNTSGEGLIARLKAIKAAAEQAGTESVNYFLESLSGYVITDMKSGAMMKVVDKVDRFDRTSRTQFPVIEREELTEALLPDMEAFEALMLGIYFEDEGIW